MEFNRETMKKIRSLILFAAFILVCLWKYQMIFHVLFPFALGGAIALILNVPMDFVERHLFRQAGKVRGRFVRKAARPVSLLLVLLLVAALAAAVSFLLVPQLGRTFEELKENIQAYTPRLQEWQRGAVWFKELQLDWRGIAVTAARSIVSKVAAFLIAFAFALYILLQKEKLGRQVRTVLFAFVRRGRAEAALEVCAFTYRTFAGFLAGQCVEALILGGLFVVSMLILKIPYALLMGVVIGVTALVPVFGAFVGWGDLDLPGRPGEGPGIPDPVSGAPGDRGRPYLSPCGGKFRRPAANLGTGGGERRGKSYGSNGNAGLDPAGSSDLCPVPGDRVPETETEKNRSGEPVKVPRIC